MIFVLFGLLAIIWFFLYKLNIPIFFPLVLFFFGWSILFLFFSLVPLDYYFKAFSLKVCLLLIACLILFFTGSVLSVFLLDYKNIAVNVYFLNKPFISTRFIFAFSIFMALLYCLVSFPSSYKKIVASSTAENVLTELRSQHWEDFSEGKVDLEKRALTFTRPFALLFAVGLCFFRKNKFLCALSLFCFSAIFVENLTTAGRFLIGIVIFLIGYLFFVQYLFERFAPFSCIGLRLLSKRPAYLLFFLVFLLLGISLLAFFPIARNSLLLENPDLFINYMYSATVSNNSYTNFGRAMLYGVSYLSDPLAKLTFFIEEGGIEKWSAGGLYCFPHIFEPLSKIVGGSSKWLALRLDIALLLDSINTQPNPWATGVRDIVIDFGLYGASIFMFITGFISTMLSFNFLQNGTPLALILLSILSFWLGAFAFVNVSMMGPFFNFFCVVLIIFFMDSFCKKME